MSATGRETGLEGGTVLQGRQVWAVGAAIFFIALGVRLIYLYQLAATPLFDEFKLIADVRYYDLRAKQIMGGQLLFPAPGLLSPLYCYLLSAVYLVFGPLPGAKLFQALVGSFSCVMLYLIGRRIWSDGVGVLAASMLAFYTIHIYYHGILLPATTILLLHLFLIHVLTGEWATWRFPVAGLLIALAVLAKANALLLGPFLAVWLWFANAERSPRSRLVAIGLMALCALATIAPVTAMNYRVSGKFLLVTTTGGANLLKGNGPTATGTHAFLPPGVQTTGIRAHRAGRVDPQKAVRESKELSRMAWSYMLEHPGRTLKLFGKKLLLLFNAKELGVRDQFYFAQARVAFLRWPLVSFWMIVPLGLVGACFAWRSWRRSGALYAILAAQVVSFVLIFVLARYRLVLIACLMLFASRQLLRWAESLRQRSWAPLAGSLALLAAFMAIAFIPFPEFPRDRGFADQYSFIADDRFEHGDYAGAAEAYERALASSWQDDRNVELLVHLRRIRLARARIELGQIDDARTLLMAMRDELERRYPGQALDQKEEVRQLLHRLE